MEEIGWKKITYNSKETKIGKVKLSLRLIKQYIMAYGGTEIGSTSLAPATCATWSLEDEKKSDKFKRKEHSLDLAYTGKTKTQELPPTWLQ